MARAAVRQGPAGNGRTAVWQDPAGNGHGHAQTHRRRNKRNGRNGVTAERRNKASRESVTKAFANCS